tara:strand:+ start:1282 stop:1611 length:330 start_codon:yes stop_codon:yes gene_type:complete
MILGAARYTGGTQTLTFQKKCLIRQIIVTEDYFSNTNGDTKLTFNNVNVGFFSKDVGTSSEGQVNVLCRMSIFADDLVIDHLVNVGDTVTIIRSTGMDSTVSFIGTDLS